MNFTRRGASVVCQRCVRHLCSRLDQTVDKLRASMKQSTAGGLRLVGTYRVATLPSRH
jgi:hypothetical protein